MGSAFVLGNCVLVDDLEDIIMDVLLVNQCDIFAFAVVAPKHLHIVLLDQASLFGNAVLWIGQHLSKKAIPLAICKLITVQPRKLATQIRHKIRIHVDVQILVAQLGQQTNELLFQLRLALVSI